MVLKGIKDSSGATYFFVLVVILALALLGSAIYTVASVNMNLNVMFFNTNNMFYQADSVMSRVQVIFEKAARDAQEYARAQTIAQRDSIIADATTYDPETDTYHVDMDEVQRNIERVYTEEFNHYICDDGAAGKVYLSDNLSQTQGVDSFELPTFLSASQNPLGGEVKVTAVATKNGRTKRLTAAFLLCRAPSDITVKKVISNARNPLWTRPVTTEGDLVATGGKVSIYCADADEIAQNPQLLRNWAVYAWGTNPSRSSGSNFKGESYGGILAGINQAAAVNLGLADMADSSGSLEIYGRTVTDAYIHTFESGSTISINNPLNNQDFDSISASDRRDFVYCESVQTEKSAGSSSISVSGDIVSIDDLEVHSTGGGIDVGGSFYGISSGDLEQRYANRSSSVIYDDPDNLASINIGKYLFLGGVAYDDSVYNIFDNIPYKTGESLGLGDNHRVYRYFFDSESDNPPFDSGYRLKLGDQPSPDDLPYPLYSGKTAAYHNSVGYNRVDRFKEYLIQYLKTRENGQDSQLDYLPDLGGGRISIGANNSGRLEGYSLGVVPSGGALYSPRLSQQDLADIASVPGLSSLLKPFDRIMNISDFTSLQSSLLNYYYKAQQLVLNKAASRKTSSEFGALVDENMKFTVNIDSGSNVLIADTTGGDLTVDFDSLNGKGGLILSAGRLIVTGNSDSSFKGSLVSKGSIVFKGPGRKTITYDEKEALDAISKDSKMRAYLSKGGISEVIPDSMEIILKAEKNVKVLEYRELQN